MELWIMKAFGISLGLTIAIELVFAWIIGIRNKKDLLLILLVNVLTNPAVVLAYYLLSICTMWNGYFIKMPLEILVIIVEALYYKFYGNKFRRPFLFSFMANAFSFGIGIFINSVF